MDDFSVALNNSGIGGNLGDAFLNHLCYTAQYCICYSRSLWPHSYIGSIYIYMCSILTKGSGCRSIPKTVKLGRKV